MSLFTLRATGSSQEIDTKAVKDAMAILADPEHGVELRGLPSGRSIICKGNDLEALAAAAQSLQDEKSIYYCLNPIPCGLMHAARVQDILSRRWLFIDVDSVRPVDTSATDGEKEKAGTTATSIMEWLRERNWPEPLLIDSGNGWHILYRVSLPANEHVRLLFKDFLAALGKRFDTPEVQVDRVVHNASRIAKLPGTWARKGPMTDDRPHRMCKITYSSSEFGEVTAEQIVEASKPEEEQRKAPSLEDSIFTLKAVKSQADRAYIDKVLERECGRVRTAIAGPSGGRNNALNIAAVKLGHFIPEYIQRQEAEARLYEAACHVGLDTDPGCGERGIRATIASGLKKGMEEPKKVPERNGHTTAGATPHEPPPRFEIPEGVSIIIRASEVMPRKVDWLWPGILPLGKLATFAGIGGLGKTFVLCDIAARVSTGAEWPHSGGECSEVGQTLFLSGEDDPDDTLVPRLMEMGADLKKVCFLKSEFADHFTLRDLKMLDRALKDIGPAVRFVAIDPPSCFLGDSDDHKNSEIRALLSPLKTWASKHKVSVVFNTHFTKPGGAKVEAAMRVMGSVAWVNAVRAAHIFVADPENRGRVLFIPIKMNLGPPMQALSLSIDPSGDGMAKVNWIGRVDVTADQATNGDRRPREVVASEWLIERFREKREWEFNELLGRARAAGVSRNAMFEAKAALAVPTRADQQAAGPVAFWWWVPPDWCHFHSADQETV